MDAPVAGALGRRLTCTVAGVIKHILVDGLCCCDVAESEVLMFCSRCGLTVKEGTRFCQGCGQEIDGPATGPAASPAPAYAGFWVRFVASCIDGLILGIPVLFLAMVFLFLLGGFGLVLRRNAIDPRGIFVFTEPVILGIVIAAVFILVMKWLYFAVMESSTRQATLGKMAMSLRVTDREGRRLSFGRATARFFAKIVSTLITLGIGYFVAGFTKRKQALHDMMAGTLVFRE
ncbi:MAG TPA: RDD family protein [Candidatus Dormibacteraeota bacterium]|nr:RDD family protein [Candidatus Dormibacteraeota bacterium]